MSGGGVTLWSSKKQTCITNSTMMSEFIVLLASASKEAEWLLILMFEIPLLPKHISSMALHCDSNSALVRAYS